MMENFWEKIKKPIFCLAPMADVTDCAFRQIIAKYSRYGGKFTRQSAERVGGPDIFFTEFVSADGLCSTGKDKLLIDLIYGENERPIVAQIFGSKPENIRKASALCKELGFDGIDINMGCPDKSIEKQCAGAAMMKNPELAREIVRAAIDGGGGLPVSVKTRIGYNPPPPKGFGRASKNDYLLDEEWIRNLLSENLAALTLHLRTRKEMSDVPAHWDMMKRIVEIRDEAKVKTLILGNGDVLDLKDAEQKVEETGCDGVMLGRAIFGNPWLFRRKIASGETWERVVCLQQTQHAEKQTALLFRAMPVKAHADVVDRHEQAFSAEKYPCSPEAIFLKETGSQIKEKLKVLVEHTNLYEKMLGEHKNFAIMKKHFKAYVNGFDGAKELRVKLKEADNASQIESIVNDFLGN